MNGLNPGDTSGIAATSRRGLIPPPSEQESFYPEPIFSQIIFQERKRTERYNRPFLLILFDLENILDGLEDNHLIKTLEESLSSCLRKTDIRGWYKQGRTIGIILLEIGSDRMILEKVFLKIRSQLVKNIGTERFYKIKISYHSFPESSNGNGKDRDWFRSQFYPEVAEKPLPKRFPFLIKRGLDILGSTVGLLAFSPALLIIALGIKFTSKGPVLFRQERVGQWGKTFTLLKFRSMHVDCEDSAHREYVRKLITRGKGTYPGGVEPQKSVVYKLTNDRRITPLGNILRKTSLDEIPQFINVLRGEMSLVGPRPPLPYECEVYALWHRRRLTTVKPGITGLWQVKGRSRQTFDEMVRLDLNYIAKWSLWVDLKIILKTPWVMLKGAGAY